MTYVLPTFICLLALGCVALAKFNHFRDVFQRKPSEQTQRIWQWSGNVLIVFCLSVNLMLHGNYGWLLFCGHLAVSLLFWVLILHYFAKSTSVILPSLTLMTLMSVVLVI